MSHCKEKNGLIMMFQAGDERQPGLGNVVILVRRSGVGQILLKSRRMHSKLYLSTYYKYKKKKSLITSWARQPSPALSETSRMLRRNF